MVAIAKRNRSRKSVPAWHSLFSAMLPRIIAHARISFRHLRAEAREDAAAECVAMRDSLVVYEDTNHVSGHRVL